MESSVLPLQKGEPVRVLEVGLSAGLHGFDEPMVRPPVLGQNVLDRQGTRVRHDPGVRRVVVRVIRLRRRVVAAVVVLVRGRGFGEVAEQSGRHPALVAGEVRQHVARGPLVGDAHLGEPFRRDGLDHGIELLEAGAHLRQASLLGGLHACVSLED
jgi:hypothetical protein